MSFYHRANRVSGPLRAIGGRLSVEDDRLVFRPHGFERLLQAKEWSVPVADIVRTGVAAKNVRQPFSGGTRSRLELELRDGTTQLFVISDPAQRAEELAALGRGDSPDLARAT